MKLLKIILMVFALSATFPLSAFADTGDYQVAMHLGSKHFEPGYNGENPGLGLRIKDGEETYYQLGGYHNSVKRTTIYAIYGYEPFKIGNISFGGFLGVTSGYATTTYQHRGRECGRGTCQTYIKETQVPNSKLTPAAGFTATAHFEKVNVMLVGLPTIGKHAGSLSLTLLFPF